jgi:hypothetical protein
LDGDALDVYSAALCGYMVMLLAHLDCGSIISVMRFPDLGRADFPQVAQDFDFAAPLRLLVPLSMWSNFDNLHISCRSVHDEEQGIASVEFCGARQAFELDFSARKALGN